MLYRIKADIVKKGSFYTLATPDRDYTSINYSQHSKVVGGNYASEAYNNNPYSSNLPLSGSWNFYATYKLNAIEADSSNQLIFGRFYVDDRYFYSENYLISRVYQNGGFNLSFFLGQNLGSIVTNITKSSMKLFINQFIKINRREDDGEDVLLFTVQGSVTYIADTEKKRWQK